MYAILVLHKYGTINQKNLWVVCFLLSARLKQRKVFLSTCKVCARSVALAILLYVLLNV